MNLRKLFSRKATQTGPVAAAAAPAARDTDSEGSADAPSDGGGNVIAFPLRPDWYEFSPEARPAVTPDAVRFKGMMNEPEITAFFHENYFAYGRHNGSHYRNHEALEQGRQARIAQFQNVLTELFERKQTKINKLQSELLAIEGISPLTSAQLRLACEHLKRDIEVLREQSDLASSGKGWIREALNRYETGFAKGLREALEFDLLAR